MPFTAVQAQAKAFVQVAEQISEAIEGGEFAVGQMLPPERELCQRLGVSRPVMREALSALQLLGIVQTRAGLGTFVGSDARHVLGTRIWALAAEHSPGEVMEARLMVEPGAAALAAARLSPERRQTLEEVLAEMRGVATEGTDASTFGPLDFRFHQAVADASGNGVISKFMHAVVGYANQLLWRSMRDSSYRYSNGLALRYLAQHEQTYACLVAGDGPAAAGSMLGHLRTSQEAALFGDGQPEAQP